MPAPVNDNIASAITLTQGSGSLGPYTIDSATTEGGEPDSLGSSNKSIWFKFVASANGSAVHFSTFGSLAGDAPSGDGLSYGAFGSLDTVMAIWTGTSAPTGLHSNNDDSAFDPEGGYWSEVTIGVTAGVTYWVQVGVLDPSYVGTVILRWQNIPSTTYADAVLAEGPEGYWRLGDPHGPRALDLSSSNFHGTYTNGPTQDQPGLLGSDTDEAVSFDGSDDYVDLSNPAGLRLAASWTLEAWIKVATGETVFGSLINQHYDGSKVPFMLGSFDGGGETMKPSVGFYNGSWHIAQSSTLLTANTIHHLVGTWDGTDLKIYVDGVLKATTTPGSSPSSSTENVWIGRRWDTGGLGPYYKGVIDEVAMYTYDIGATRIAAHYSAGTGSTPGTATPSVTAGVGAVPAPTASGAGLTTPATTVGVGAVPGPNAVGGGTGTANPATVAGVGAVPASTPTGAAHALPSAVAGVGAVPAPSAQGRATASPARVAGVGAVPSPSISLSPNAQPTAVAGTARIPHPRGFGAGTGGGGGTTNGIYDFWSVKALG